MKELEILEREFERAGLRFPGLYHKFVWRGKNNAYSLMPSELRQRENWSFRQKSFKDILHVSKISIEDIVDPGDGKGNQETSSAVALRQWPHDVTEGNERNPRPDHAHFLIKSSSAMWDPVTGLQRLSILAKKLLPYIESREKSLSNDPLFAYWDENPTYLNDNVFYGEEIGYDVKLLLALHILTSSESLCSIDNTTKAKEGEPYVRTLDDVFLDGALVCTKLMDLAEELKKPGSRTVPTFKKLGRPKVSQPEAAKRRKLKADWDRARDEKVSKAHFCDDQDIDVGYLNNCVMRWSRDHPK